MGFFRQLKEQYEKCTVDRERYQDAAKAATDAMKRKWRVNDELVSAFRVQRSTFCL